MAGRVITKIVGRPWPCYGDTQEYKDAFYRDFERLATEKGCRLIE
jgi:hypothetical protein